MNADKIEHEEMAMQNNEVNGAKLYENKSIVLPMHEVVWFYELVKQLKDYHGMNWVRVLITMNTTEWCAKILETQATDAPELCSGCGDTIYKACWNCVDDFHKRNRELIRKAQLMEMPEVREALFLLVEKPVSLPQRRLALAHKAEGLRRSKEESPASAPAASGDGAEGAAP